MKIDAKMNTKRAKNSKKSKKNKKNVKKKSKILEFWKILCYNIYRDKSYIKSHSYVKKFHRR